MIKKENVKDIYQLSPMQEGMLFHALYTPGSTAYFQQVSYEIAGDMDQEIFRKSWEELQRRHDILRTVFVHEKTKRSLQVVLKNFTFAYHYEDVSAKIPSLRRAVLDEYGKKNMDTPFDLRNGPLSRVALFRLEARRYVVIWSFPHILMDGWSAGILTKELVGIYRALATGGVYDPPEPVPYAKYIEWVEKSGRDNSKGYWESYLDGYRESATLPASGKASNDAGFAPGALEFELSDGISAKLREMSARYHVTVSNIFETVWGIVLSRYNGRDDVVFGSVVSGRPEHIPGVEEMVGLFINTVPVRIRIREGETFAETLARVRDDSLSARDHHHMPLAEIQLWSGMINHIMAFENYPLDEKLAEEMASDSYGIRLENVTAHEQTSYDFNLIIVPSDRFRIIIRHNENVYDESCIARIAEHLKTAIDSAVANPEATTNNIEILPENETRLLTKTFAGDRHDQNLDDTILSRFDAHVKASPDRPAVVMENEIITYGKLNELAETLARHLTSASGVQPGSRVAVALERSDALATSFVGVMKTGAIYVPIDPAYPRERVEFMLRDSRCDAIISEGAYAEEIARAVDVDVIDIRNITVNNEAPPSETAPGTTADTPAYMIYTSGSTGVPKGVVIPHRGIINLMEHQRRLFDFIADDRVAQFASPSFDASIWEMCLALTHGASLTPASRETVADPKLFGEFLRNLGATTILLPPSYISSLDRRDLESLKTLVTGGEAAQPAHADYFKDKLRFVNAYGPTEYSIIATCHLIKPDSARETFIPIGRPVDNTRMFITDPRGRLTPIGVAGEICVAGAGLATGYWNRPELTAEKFVANPFKPGGKMYRTGDLGRWLDNGEVEYLGRIDFQVKIRGFRVELGEIESTLRKFPDARQAIVIDRDGGGNDKILVAYLVFNNGYKPEDRELRNYLKEKLPDFMIPAHFVVLDQIPLTPNGKVDRAALPAPGMSGAAREKDYTPPSTPTETEMAKIWAEVFGLEKIGVHDDFFHAGGHSLKAMQVVSRARERFQVDLPLRSLFEKPTVAELSKIVDELKSGAKENIGAIKKVARESRRSVTQPRDNH